MKRFIIPAALLLTPLSMMAVSPMWMRDVKMSPDGSTIVFSYKGDLFTVPAIGGKATRLTTTEAYESSPIWSPKGDKIAYASDRNGGKDVYIIPATGGQSTRLTYNSVAETPEAFSPDGKNVIFSAYIQKPSINIGGPHRSQSELYSVPSEGGRPVQILSIPAVSLAMRPDGSFLYENVKGSEDKWRKHHTSSVTRDIWMYNPSSRSYTNLTARAGEDREPVVASDNNSFYFLSERDGDSFNVYRQSISGKNAPEKLTSFTKHPVRFLSAGAGDILAFTYNGELYTMKPGGKASKLPIDIVDDFMEDVKEIPFSRVQGAVVSPDGKQVAFTVRGEVFVTSSDYSSTKQITHTPAIENALTWGSDGRSLYYGSLRNGRSNIYRATIKRDDDPNFSNATVIEEKEMFSNDGVERGYPSVSPDGKKMVFVEDRTKLKVLDFDSKKVRTLSDDRITTSRSSGIGVEWSPDSKWITLEVMNPMHEPYGDIAIINVEDGEFINITNTGYFDQNPRFTSDGSAVVFESERYGMRNHASWGSESDVMMVFLTKDAYDKFRMNEEDYELFKEVEDQQKKDSKKKDSDSDKKNKDSKKKNSESDKEDKSIKIDREGIQDRIVRLTPNSSNLADFVVSKDGSTLYYLSSFEDGYDLWSKDLRKGDVSMIKKLGSSPAGIQTDKNGNIYLVGATVRKFIPSSKSLKNISTSGSVKIDPYKEREAMFNFMANEAQERFYLAKMPINWKEYVENYRKFLPHINNNYDFQMLLSEILGELNVSHSGGRYSSATAKDATASLGLIFDLTTDKDGLRIEEIMAGGPFDRSSTRVKAGDIVEAINGEKIKAGKDWTSLLNNTAKKKTLVSFFSPKSGERWEEVVLPISTGVMSGLTYNRWVKRNEHLVDSLSGGRLGYVHIQSMSDGSFRTIYSKILGEFNNREGIVIDTRWNGGGRLHEDIEVLFSGEQYLTQENHGVKSATMPSRRWNKPSIMVTGEANYSNAHGTPWVYKHKNLGKVVGMPVPGTMSSVNWITMQDPSMVFGIPVTAFRTAEGTVLENSQLEPDILVENKPEDVVNGKDAQLETAVKELLKEVDQKKK